MEEKELFGDYEIKGWQPNPRIYQILGASVLVHLLVLVTLSQLNLLQTKACDSPYVGKVCQVLDAAYLGSVLLGEDTEFSSRDYNKTEISDADITYIDASSAEPPLEYPAGYFALTNPESAVSETGFPTDFSGSEFTMPPSSSPSQLDLNAPQVLPTPNNSVANQTLPDSPFSIGNDTPKVVSPPVRQTPNYRAPRGRTRVPANKQPKNDSPGALPDLGNETAKNTNGNTNQQVAKNDNNSNANKSPDDANKDSGTGFNQKPLKDFGAKYGEQILSKKVDINAPFTITIRAALDENGKLVKPKMDTTKESDPAMTKVATEAILAFGDSQLLKPLYDVGGRNVIITFAQNQDNLQAIIQTETKNEMQAKVLQSGLNLYINNFFKPKEGSDEQVLMKKAQFATQGNLFIINFLISNDEKNMMIERSLKNLKQEQEQQKTQPNSVAVNKDANANS